MVEGELVKIGQEVTPFLKGNASLLWVEDGGLKVPLRLSAGIVGYPGVGQVRQISGILDREALKRTGLLDGLLGSLSSEVREAVEKWFLMVDFRGFHWGFGSDADGRGEALGLSPRFNNFRSLGNKRAVVLEASPQLGSKLGDLTERWVVVREDRKRELVYDFDGSQPLILLTGEQGWKRGNLVVPKDYNLLEMQVLVTKLD